MAEKMVKKHNKEDEVLSKKDTARKDDVLILTDEELDNSLNKKKSKRSSSAQKSVPSSSRTAGSSSTKSSDKNAINDSNSDLMSILKSIQKNQEDQGNKLKSLTDKVDEMYDYEGDDYEYDENGQDDHEYDIEPPAKKARFVSDSNNNQNKEKETDQTENNTSRFAAMSKSFKQKEITGSKIDETLAVNITDLLRNGMDETQYNELIKDEQNPRPENCEGLVVVRTNQLIWELISPFAQTSDKKIQNIERSLVKAAVLLCRTVNKCAQNEKEKGTEQFTDVIEECNDVLAVLGHTNRQINITRRDFIEYELNNEYTHLCAQSQPYTTHVTAVLDELRYY